MFKPFFNYIDGFWPISLGIVANKIHTLNVTSLNYILKLFSSENGCKSDEEVNEPEVRNEGDDAVDANTTTEAATVVLKTV